MDLGTYLKPLRRMWWLILAAVVVATVASFLMLRRVPPTYQSRRASNGRPCIAERESRQRQPLHEPAVGHRLRRPRYSSSICGRRSKRRWTSIRPPSYSARIVPGTQLIELTVEDELPLRARAIANEVANQLIRLTPAGTGNVDQSRQAFVAQQLDELEASIVATHEEITRKQSELASMLSARQIADAQTQITALEAKLQALQANCTRR